MELEEYGIEIDDGELLQLICSWLWAVSKSGRKARKADVEAHPDGGPMGVRDFMGTELANGEKSFSLQERLTRCNELCNWAILEGPRLDSVRLVHGTIHGRYNDVQRIRHAWLLLHTPFVDICWEPATRLWYEKEPWYEWARAWDEREYTRAQVIELTRTSGHYGPWHESRYK